MLFIDGPLAGRLEMVLGDVDVYLALDPTWGVDDVTGMRMPTSFREVSYHPVGGGSQNHDPQPWTSARPPITDEAYFRMLAAAWHHMHGPRSERVHP